MFEEDYAKFEEEINFLALESAKTKFQDTLLKYRAGEIDVDTYIPELEDIYDELLNLTCVIDEENILNSQKQQIKQFKKEIKNLRKKVISLLNDFYNCAL